MCESWLSDKSSSKENILDYVSSFQKKLHHACALAPDSFATSQSKMKTNNDKKSVAQKFQAGDRIPVLLPIVCSGLQANFLVYTWWTTNSVKRII